MSAQGQWQIEPIEVRDCVEWHSRYGVATHGISPGEAVIESRRRTLYFSPGYLLAINFDGGAPPLAAVLSAIPIDVTGKWRGFRLTGPRAGAVLAAGAHVELLLQDRVCAALSLFDCPVVLLRTADAYEVWVLASYTESLCQALNKMEKML